MHRAAKPISRSLLAFGAASATATVVSFRSGPVFADEVGPSSSAKQKLPIYPKPDPEIQLVRTDSELARHVGVSREYATSTYLDAQSKVHSAVEKWIGVETAVERQVKEIIPADEPMTPGLLYVGVATLTGSVLSRRRSLPIRVLLPPAFFAISLAYFLPKTSHNLSAYLSSLESHYAPGFAAQHSEFSKTVSQSISTASQRYTDAKVKASEGLDTARRQIQEQTGLKVGDFQADTRVTDVKAHAQETISRIQAETQALGNKVQDGVEGLKEQVEGALGESKTKVEAPEEPPKRLV